MALGKFKSVDQPLFIVTEKLPVSKGHPYYEAVNKMLATQGFDAVVEQRCAEFYAKGVGRPGMAPGVYFRCLMIGYLEGIDSERGIAWRVDDSISLRNFLGLALDQSTPDHSTLSRTRRLISLEAHAEVFQFMLKVLASHSLIDGRTAGIDGTTLEANAAMKSIVRRDTGESYTAFLERLAKESGIETPTREDLARLDRKRKNKASNDDWENPNDPDAKITKMKDGSTHLAHKAEHVVDLGDKGHGALLGVNICDAAAGDTRTLVDTLARTMENLNAVADDATVSALVDEDRLLEGLVSDKGYHSKEVIATLQDLEIRSYVSEPKRGRQRWTEDGERAAVYANRRRIRGDRGKSLLRRRGEKLERSFAHCYETGGLRRLHLRGRKNIAKRALIHAAGFNLGLLMRVSYGLKKPRGLGRAVFCLVLTLLGGLQGLYASILSLLGIKDALRHFNHPRHRLRLVAMDS